MTTLSLNPAHAVVALLMLGVLAGCAAQPPRVDTETTPAADFSSRHTFAWQDSQASYDPRAKATRDVEQVKAAIHAEVLAQLAQKGYSEASGHKPDFLVSFHLVVTETDGPELCIRRYAIFDFDLGLPGGDTYEICRYDAVMARRTVRKGTLVVFVVDAATRTLLWQGVADEDRVSRKNQVEKLRAAVERMFASFPAESA